jgi:hypothetical protein
VTETVNGFAEHPFASLANSHTKLLPVTTAPFVSALVRNGQLVGRTLVSYRFALHEKRGRPKAQVQQLEAKQRELEAELVGLRAGQQASEQIREQVAQLLQAAATKPAASAS